MARPEVPSLTPQSKMGALLIFPSPVIVDIQNTLINTR
jgi:hypothetical protein